MIDKAIARSDYSKSEKPRILKETKRFFRELSYPIASDGLGLVNPAISIKVKQIQNEVVLLKRRRSEACEIMPPQDRRNAVRIWHHLTAEFVRQVILC